MQEKILLFLQEQANPFWDALFHFFSFLGEPLIYMLILSWLIWNGSKKKGFAFSFVLMFSVLVNLALKMIFRHPRPFQVVEGVDGKRLSTAGGYSFPSGHTQNAATFYFSLYARSGKIWILPIVSVIVLLIGLSRLYLGVHWPQDVAVGLILGILFPLLLFKPFCRIYEVKRHRLIFLAVTAVGSFVLGIGCYAASFFLPSDFDWGDIHKFTLMTTGLAVGYLAEMLFGEFSTDGTFKIKILRYLLGLIPVAAVYLGIKFLLPDFVWLDMVRYFLVGLTATGLVPQIGKKMKLFGAG